jgi:hypothetical protein
MDENDLKSVKELICIENEHRKVLNIEGKKLLEKLNTLKDKQILKSDNKTLLKKYLSELKVNQDYIIKPLNTSTLNNFAKIHYFYLNISNYGNIFLTLKTCFSGGSYDESDKLKLKLNALNEKLNKDNYEQIRQEKKLLYKEMDKIKPYCIYKDSDLYLGRHEQGILKEVDLYQKQELLNEQEQIKLLTELEDLTKKQLNKKQEVNNIFEPIYKYFRGGF